MPILTSRGAHLRRPDVNPRLNERSVQAERLLAWWPIVPENGVASYAEKARHSPTGAAADPMTLSFPAMGTPAAGNVTFYITHKTT